MKEITLKQKVGNSKCLDVNFVVGFSKVVALELTSITNISMN